MTPQAFTLPYPPILFPQRLYLDNFAEAWGSNHFSDYFLNSVLVSLISTVLIILVSSLAGYGFARIAFPGKNILFMILMFSMMVPTLTNLLPQFLLIKGLKLMDKYTGLILTYLGTGIAANTFFLRSSFLSVPHALEESVVIDGGGHWTIWLHIAMPPWARLPSWRFPTSGTNFCTP